jgi:competence protein ComEA
MSQKFSDLIEQRQQQMRKKDRQMRLLYVALAALAVLALAVVFLRPDPTTGPVNINRAPVGVLVSLPDIGPEIAQRIIDARPIADEEALQKVKGIGPKTMEKIRPRVVFDTP